MTDEELEQLHFKRIIKAFSTFSSRMNRRLCKHYQDWDKLDPTDQEYIIPEYKRRLDRISESFQVNQHFFDLIVHGHQNIEEEEDIRTTDRDYENLRSTLRQLVREWSEEGAEERRVCFKPILDTLSKEFPQGCRNGISVLIPGAGLGRLAWEISRVGFSVQGNEFSLYMLLTSQFVLNFCPQAQQHEIIPFAFPLSNHSSLERSCRAVRIPDVSADSGQDASGDLSMTAGDFIEVYSRNEEQSAWDCIVTCFFLDTAQNVLEYLKVIRGALRSGGLWINLGPLQYHFESAVEMSIELTWEEIVLAATRLGFTFSQTLITDNWQSYAHDPLSLSKTSYRTVYSVATLVKE
jgi:carnosine N-methyltransferase